MKDSLNQDDASNSIVETTAESLTAKQKVGDAANRWLARNRSLVLRQTPVWAQSLTAIIISLGSLTLIGGIFFRIDEVVTVQGQLKSIGGTVEVETPAGGRVADVFFKDGQLVGKGDLLIQFDTRKAAEEKATLKNLIKNEEEQLKSQLKTIESQISTMANRKDVLNQRLKTKTTITFEMKKLVEKGGFQRIQYLDQVDQLFELKKQISELDEQENRIKLQSNQIKLRTKKSIDQMTSRLKNADLQLQYQNVKAPISGVIFDPKARPEAVLQPGERILSIVPQQGFFAEVFVPNQDIGFIKIGQTAKVRVDAFPFTRYGEIDGTVSNIGADALPPDPTVNFYRFPVKLNLETNYLENKGIKIPLKSGMSITSNLKLRDKRIISLVSDLLVDQTDSIRSIRQQ